MTSHEFTILFKVIIYDTQSITIGELLGEDVGLYVIVRDNVRTLLCYENALYD